MAFIAAVLPVVLTFAENLKTSRPAEAYALMSPAAQKALGREQFNAYIASRQRVLGRLIEVKNVRRSSSVTAEHGLTVYEADARFEKGVAPAWFVVGDEGILRFGLDMPNGTVATPDEKEVKPVVDELLALVKSSGVAALADRFSEKDLAEVNQTIDAARAAMTMIDAVAGPLESYTIGAPGEDGEATCRTARGEAKFRNGSAPMTIRLCWSDGLWRLRHAQFTPQMNPVMLERSVAYALQGKAKVSCPRDAKFPVGGKIVCRVTPDGEAPQDATILRTTESGWEIVGLAPVTR